MSSIINSCFMCSNADNCGFVHQGIVDQVGYVLPEITVVKKKIPLRICNICRKILQIFNKFKHESIQNCQEQETDLINKRAQTCQPTGTGTVPLVQETDLINKRAQTCQPTGSGTFPLLQESTIGSKHVDNISKPPEKESIAFGGTKNVRHNSNTVIPQHEIENAKSFIRCNVCNTFISKGYYITHLNTHSEYNCFVCYLSLPTKNAWEEHILSHNSDVFGYNVNFASTSKINETCVSQSELNKHNLTHFRCPICLTSFAKRSVLDIHLKSHKKPVKPVKNAETVKNEESSNMSCKIIQTETQVTYIKNFKTRQYLCWKCPEFLSSKTELKEHLKEHNLKRKSDTTDTFITKKPKEMKLNQIEENIYKSLFKDTEENDSEDNNQKSTFEIRQKEKTCVIRKPVQGTSKETEKNVEVINKDFIIKNLVDYENLLQNINNSNIDKINKKNQETSHQNLINTRNQEVREPLFQNNEKQNQETSNQNLINNAIRDQELYVLLRQNNEKQNIVAKNIQDTQNQKISYQDVFSNEIRDQEVYLLLLQNNEKEDLVGKNIQEKNNKEISEKRDESISDTLTQNRPQNTENEERIQEIVAQKDLVDTLTQNRLQNTENEERLEEIVAQEASSEENVQNGQENLLEEIKDEPMEHQQTDVLEENEDKYSIKEELDDTEHQQISEDSQQTEENTDEEEIKEYLFDNLPEDQKYLEDLEEEIKYSIIINPIHRDDYPEDISSEDEKNSKSEMDDQITTHTQNAESTTEILQINENSSKEFSDDISLERNQLQLYGNNSTSYIQLNNTTWEYQLQTITTENQLQAKGPQLHTNSEPSTNQLQTRGTRLGNQLQNEEQTSIPSETSAIQSNKKIRAPQLHTDSGSSTNQLQTRGTRSGDQLQNEPSETSATQSNKKNKCPQLPTNSEPSTNQLQTRGTQTGNQLQNEPAETSASQSNKKIRAPQLHTNSESSSNQLQTRGTLSGDQLQNEPSETSAQQSNKKIRAPQLHTDSESSTNQLQTRGTRSGDQLQNEPSETSATQSNKKIKGPPLHTNSEPSTNQLQTRGTPGVQVKKEPSETSNEKFRGPQLQTDSTSTRNQLQKRNPCSRIQVKIEEQMPSSSKTSTHSKKFKGPQRFMNNVVSKNKKFKNRQLLKEKVRTQLHRAQTMSLIELHELSLSLTAQLKTYMEQCSRYSLNKSRQNLQTSRNILRRKIKTAQSRNNRRIKWKKKIRTSSENQLQPKTYQLQKDGTVLGIQLQECSVQLGNKLNMDKIISKYQLQTKSATSWQSKLRNIKKELPEHREDSHSETELQNKDTFMRKSKIFEGIELQSDNTYTRETRSGTQLHSESTNQLQSGTISRTQLQKNIAKIKQEKEDVCIRKSKIFEGIELQTDHTYTRETRSGTQLHSDKANQLQSGTMSRTQLQKNIAKIKQEKEDVCIRKSKIFEGIELQTDHTYTRETRSGTQLHSDSANQLQSGTLLHETNNSVLDSELDTNLNQLHTSESTSEIQLLIDLGSHLPTNIENQLQKSGPTSEIQLHVPRIKLEKQLQIDNRALGSQLQTTSDQLQTKGSTPEIQLQEPIVYLGNQLQIDKRALDSQLQTTTSDQLQAKGSTPEIQSQEPIVHVENQLQVQKRALDSQLQTNTSDQLQAKGSTPKTQLHEPNIKKENQLQIDKRALDSQLHTTTSDQLQAKGSTPETQSHEVNIKKENQLQIDKKALDSQLQTTTLDQLQTMGSTPETQSHEVNIKKENQLQIDKKALDSQLQTTTSDQLQTMGSTSKIQSHEVNIKKENQLQIDKKGLDSQLQRTTSYQLQSRASTSKIQPHEIKKENQQTSVSNLYEPVVYLGNKVEIKKCQICQSSFTNLQTLINHMKNHKCEELLNLKLIGEKQCIICDKNFARPSYLKDHLYNHLLCNIHCHICNKFCETKYHLNTHMSEQHMSVQLKLCLICRKQFKSMDRLLYHLKFVQDELHTHQNLTEKNN